MEKYGNIEIRVSGSNGNMKLTPDTYDIKELIPMLENVENLLYPNDKKNRPTISYQVEEGSVKHVFRTSLQFIISFNAVLGQVSEQGNIDFLEVPTAKAIENIQETAKKKNYSIELRTSINESNSIELNAQTKYYRTEAIWADAEFYFYGKITNAGGKSNPNMHIYTEEMGSLIIKTPQEFLENRKENLLYKTFGIRAKGRQHSTTGEIDTSSLEFIDLIDYNTEFNRDYIQRLRNKAKESWVGKINADQWLKEIRGYE